MNATVCCGLLMVKNCEPLMETNITICVGIKVEERPNWQAFARTFVIRIVRTKFVPGASIGTPNQVTWLGVPIDAPGTNFVRTIRITNVRANACQLGLSSTLIPTQIVMFVSINGSQFFTINNPQQTVAFIQLGLIVGSSSSNITQCVNLNVGGGGNGLNFFGSTPIGTAEAAVNLREGFAASFKRRDVPALGQTFIGFNGVPEGVQNVPGFSYNTESGLQPQTALDGATGLGLADFATRFLIRLNNVGTGVRIIFPVAVPLTTNNAGSYGAPTLPSNFATGGNPNPFTGGFIRLLGTTDLQGNSPASTSTFGFATPTTTFSGGTVFLTSSAFKG